jgi:dipeptidyl aminopeptidase/acylaminoacyl peptidase
MMPKHPALYGTWRSPISPKLVGARVRFHDVQWAGDALVWHETRGTASALFSQQDGQAPRDISGELIGRGKLAYGGGELGTHDALVLFVGRDGRLYRTSVQGGTPRAVTPAFGGMACPTPDPTGTRAVYAHTYEDSDCLALADLSGAQWPRKLFAGSDFVMNPVWSPDGMRLAFIAYDMPAMPWDSTRLLLLTLTPDGVPHALSTLAGAEGDCAITQPAFSPDGRTLSYLSDKGGMAALMLHDLESGQTRAITPDDGDYSGPGWLAGLRYYAWLPDSRQVVVRRSDRAHHTLWRIDTQTGQHTALLPDAGYTYFEQMCARASDGRIACIASASDRPHEVISFSPDSGEVTVHARSVQTVFEAGALSIAQPITWQGADGETVHGLYYPPASTRFESEGLPPLIVHVHGGPTSQAVMRFEPELQYWATRGYAVLAVNFRGSTGYGRAYMQRLYGDWGGVDVQDAVSGADALAARGWVDRSKCVIYGGSSGGYAVLRALTVHQGQFCAGVNLYGVADQFALVRDTHKFERAYSDMLLGKLPQAAALYRERSPLLFADRIRDPLIIFQGSDDTVVPQNQSDAMVRAIRAAGTPVEYHVYAGEGHGFRKPETVEHYLNAAREFLERVVVYR